MILGYYWWYQLGYEVVTLFKIQKLDKVNKSNANIPRTIRFPQDLFDDYNNLSNETGVSFNSLVLSAMRYAYKDLEIDDNSNSKK